MRTALSLFFVLLYAQLFAGVSSEEYANFYYYQNQPYYLDRVYDRVYIQFENAPSLSEINNVLGLNAIFDRSSISAGQDRQIIKLNSPIDNASLKNIVNSLNNVRGVKTASPVFKMQEGKGNPDTYIGVENEIIAQFKFSVSENALQSYLNSKEMSIVTKYDLSGGNTYLIKLKEGSYSVDLANELYTSGLVNYSEPNFYYTNLLQQSHIPNDPFYPMQWSHNNLGNNIPENVTGVAGCDMATDSAWAITTGSDKVIVSVVDSGIDTLHEDISANIIHGLNYDGFTSQNNGMDQYGHGTSCAGIIAAIGDNNIGVSGTAPKSRLYSIKIFNATGGTTTAAISNGMIQAWQRGCWISSNSWGGGSPISAADNAILDGVTLGRGGKGIIWCVATGNSNGSTVNWPSTNPNVITVGGVSPCNQRKSTSSCDGENWWGSQYGTGLEIVSPCVKVYTIDITGSGGFVSGNYSNNFNGTSSATPNVSGVCALVLAVDSTLRWDSVRARICRTADKVGTYTYDQPGQLSIGGWNNQMGYGKINAHKVVKLTQEMAPGSGSAGFPESFEGTTFPPAGWTVITPIGGTGWSRELAGTTPVPGFKGGVITTIPTGGTAVAFCNYESGGTKSSTDQWLVTHKTANVITVNDSLTFWLRKSFDYQENFQVKVSTTTPTVSAFTQTIANLTIMDSGWVRYSYSLAQFAGQRIHIGFREFVADNFDKGDGLSLDLVDVKGTLTGISNSQTEIPNEFSLKQNYPNPFNPVTRIQYSIASESVVTLKVFDVSGREVATLVDSPKMPGNYTADFNGANLSSGIYFYKLQAGSFVETRKMVLVK